jgi:DNA helicase-2/ATP-dependent DNA helicase PcrA
VDEIPDEHIVRKNVTRGYSYSDKAWDRNHSYEPDYSEPTSGRPIIKTGPVKSTYRITPQKPQASKPVPDFKTGDRVKHRAFGEGVISKMTPMGGDYLIEIDFGGTVKKLMLKAAVNFMEKL